MHKENCYNLFWSAKKKLKIKNLYVVSELVIWSGDQNTCKRMYYVYVVLVSVQGVESLWGDCRFIPADFAFFEDFSL